MINRRYTVGLLALLAVALGCVCVTPVSALERVVFGTSSSQLFSPSEAVFLQTEEGEASFAEEEAVAADSEWQAVGEAEAEEEAEAALEAEAEGDSDSESESEAEAEAEAEAEEEGDALADEDEFDLDVEADESAEQELDAAAQQSLQHYAAAQGALDSDVEAEAEAEANAALDSLSSEAVLSEAEMEMERDASAATTTTTTASGAATGKQAKGKGKGKGKKQATKKPAPGLALSQLNLRDDKGEGAKINLAQGKGRFSMGVNAAGVFSIDMERRTVLSVSGKSGMVRARGDVTVWNTLSAGSLTLNQVPQWKLVREDTFEKFVTLPKRPVIDVSAPAPNRSKGKGKGNGKGQSKDGKPAVAPVTVSAKDLSNGPKPPAPPGATGAAASTTSARPASAVQSATAALARDSVSAANKALAKKARGWLYDDVIRCNGFSMLSAKHGRTIATKYKKLPKHTQIRITATVHFIDDWQGETAWMKLNDQFVWTESHDQKGVAGKFSVCGSELYPESRFSAPIDVIWSHNQKQLTLSLGSNLDEGSDAHFAVSNVAIYTRDTSRRTPLKKKAKKVCKKDPKTKKMVCKEVKPCKKGKDGKCLPKPKPAPAAATKKF